LVPTGSGGCWAASAVAGAGDWFVMPAAISL
jgi:hypothetical protein